MNLGRGASNGMPVLPSGSNRCTCPHLATILDGTVAPSKSTSATPPVSPSVLLVSNWKFMQEYLQLCRLNLVDTSKIPYPTCHACSTAQIRSPRLHICLHCAKCCCATSNHLSEHFQACPNHFLAIETSNLHLYCYRCSNYVIHPQLEDIAYEARQFAISQFQKLSGPSESRIEYEPWKPSEDEKQTLKSVPELHTSLRGLRGLNNLGNTCFMNSVLQALVSNPMMVNYFLSDIHNRNFCSLTKSSRSCLGCESDLLVEHMFSGERIPFSPHRYLLTTWRSTDHLAGYDQQDAHDFYISTMNAIHTHIGESLILDQEERIRRTIQAADPNALNLPSSSNSMQIDLTQLPANALNGISLYSEDAFADEKCFCVTHKVFAGFLRSDVQCLACNSISTVKEAFLDISLDLERNKNPTNLLTLEQSLSRFTQPENLESFHCGVCQRKSACTKQLSIDQLPLTLCFHLKRFQHTFTSTSKIDTYMPFPLNLDMTPYTYDKSASETGQESQESASNGSSDATSSKTSNGSETDTHSPSQPSQATLYPSLEAIGKEKWGKVPRSDRAIYCLYAVVNHIGNMDTGHYTSFIRHGEEWYKCDDHHITRTTKKEVLKSRAYMLFYCRSVLEYQE